MKRAKCFLGTLLALCLALGQLSYPAFAAGGPHLFADVPETEWYSSAVQYVYERGMMSGISDITFSPNSPISRGMIVTILYRMEGQPAADRAAFTDAPAGAWYAEAAAWASANGIVAGYNDGRFGPNDPITREQLAVILYRCARYQGQSTAISGNVSAFSDGDKVSAYALDAVNWAVGAGLLQGSGNMLSPRGGATRAQAASILMRFCEGAERSCTLSVVSAMDVMCEPSGVCFLEDGSFLVTDTYNNLIWRVADGSSTVYAGGDTVTDPYDRPIGGYNDAELENPTSGRPGPLPHSWTVTPSLMRTMM